jgi:hypothetical protein
LALNFFLQLYYAPTSFFSKKNTALPKNRPRQKIKHITTMAASPKLRKPQLPKNLDDDDKVERYKDKVTEYVPLMPTANDFYDAEIEGRRHCSYEIALDKKRAAAAPQLDVAASLDRFGILLDTALKNVVQLTNHSRVDLLFPRDHCFSLNDGHGCISGPRRLP